MRLYSLVILFFFMGWCLTVISQNTLILKQSITWKDNPSKFLFFDDAAYTLRSKSLPEYHLKVNLPGSREIETVNITDAVFETLTAKETELVSASGVNIAETPIISHNEEIERNIPAGSISIIPFRRDPVSGELQKLLSFNLSVDFGEKINIPENKTIFATQSVLANGNWYRIRLSTTGIYKITYDELEEMGIPVSSIDPKNIRIYGNGEGMLPESNSVFVYDDLQENAIQVAGEEDGVFNQGDYILFYGKSPTKWTHQIGTSCFTHKFNIYDDYSYYFITTDLGPGKRIGVQETSQENPDIIVTSFNDYTYHEIDEVNLLGTGKKWYEEAFEYTSTMTVENQVPGLLADEDIEVSVLMAARSFVNSTFSVTANGVYLGQETIPLVYEGSDEAYARERTFTDVFNSVGNQITIEVEYIKTSISAMAWLDYIELNYVRSLNMHADQIGFRNCNSAGIGNISEFRISGANSNVFVWNVTDPLNVELVDGNLVGSTYSYKLPTDSLLEFVAGNGSSFYQAEYVSQVENQDLHGNTDVDLIIITHPEFLSEANQLADHHRNYDDLSTVVATTQQVYNEFSSGRQDVTAIRNYMRMLYQSAERGSEPRYLLLFGDASYDYKDRIAENTNYVPSWESSQSLSMISSYVTDDYFVLLDPDEGYNANGKLDMGVGRLPVYTKSQAQGVVNKILHYTSDSEEVMGNWRTYICFVADDEDGNLHVTQAEQLANYVETHLKDFNVDKIYLDAYPQESTPSGQRYPLAVEAINNRIEKGALVINYTGHGGELGLAHEQVVDNADIQSWKNFDNLPVFITATCEFSRYDDPTRTAAGEYVFLNPEGGAISMYTTSRATYAGANLELNKKFYKYAFRKENGSYYRMGDILMYSKNDMASNSVNTKKYVLLGDPALRIAYPKDSVATIKINGKVINEIPDTLNALAEVSIEGSIYDCEGNKLEDYNGVLITTVFDKPSKVTTYGQDDNSSPVNFYLRRNIVYKGKAEILNGDFVLSFIVPKDIAYNLGPGRISYYAHKDSSDAVGYNENIVVGGYNNQAQQDYNGPLVDLYMNDANFIDGGITDENPALYAYLQDESGINTVGNGIGHDIIAILDDEKDNPHILNDYYEADLGDFTSGTVLYPFFNLSEGHHTLYLKVWDVYNNSADATVNFVVVGSAEFTVDRLVNYPNPFFDYTNFVFEHNNPDTDLEVVIQIFSLSGQLQAEIKKEITSGGYMSEPIQWDGCNNNGKKLGRGMYIYRMMAKSSSGVSARGDGKLVILRN